MSTETHVSAPTHVAPTHVGPAHATHAHTIPARPIPAQNGHAEHNGSVAVRNGTATDTGSLRWNRVTSGGLSTLDQRQPRMRQIVGVCAWAALLGGVGLVIAIRGFIGDLLGQAPGWYEPAMILVGIIGIGLTVAAFSMVHRRRLPYYLLGGASVALLCALLLTIGAF